MPIMICSKCKKPVKDSYHKFEEICKCKMVTNYDKDLDEEVEA